MSYLHLLLSLQFIAYVFFLLVINVLMFSLVEKDEVSAMQTEEDIFTRKKFPGLCLPDSSYLPIEKVLLSYSRNSSHSKIMVRRLFCVVSMKAGFFYILL